jgi:hypothetical protein
MWQESDGAVGDLLTSHVLGRVGQIDDPVKVSAWWADHGITIDSDPIPRVSRAIGQRDIVDLCLWGGQV